MRIDHRFSVSAGRAEVRPRALATTSGTRPHKIIEIGITSNIGCAVFESEQIPRRFAIPGERR